LAVCGTLAFGGWFAACGLDENGLGGADASSNDGTIPDGFTQDGFVQDAQDAGPDVTGFDVVPLTCDEAGTPLEASCLGVPVPLGWQAIAYRESQTGCNNEPNFQELDGITDASVPPGQCFCSDCQVVGAWGCAATLYTGPTCPQNSVKLTASGCDDQAGGHFGGTITRTGDAGCSPGSQTDASTVSTSVALCEPTSCSADFCGLVSQGFIGCIIPSASDAGPACPTTGFTVARIVGTGASATCTCPQCNVGNSTAQCAGGQIVAMSQGQCGGNPVATQPLDGGCFNTGGYNSMYYEAGIPPAPTCAPAGPATGSAQLTGQTTVCCTK
jgi:hypothetical protein